MLVMSLGPVFGIVSVSVLTLTALVIAFIVVADHHVTDEHDPERANRLLTMKLRAPWKYRAARIGRRLSGD